MRKILLGTTAVVSAAIGAATITPAAAQDAPTVRLGGSIGVYYGYINQSGSVSNSSLAGGAFNNIPLSGVNGNSVIQPLVAAQVPVPAGTLTPNQNTTVVNGGNFARLGKHDIATIPNVSVIVSGKSALGFTYGGQIDIGFSAAEGNISVTGRASVNRNGATADEAYLFVSHPRFGQLRAGDEDGVLGGLMNSGFVTNMGTGGVYGVWENFQTRQTGNRTQTGPGQLGDNTKVIYMSPQFFGFDFGVSFAPNGGGFGQTGCPSDNATSGCDRAYAFRGATSAAVSPAGAIGPIVRRGEYQIAARYRGTFAGVGVAATAGYIGSGTARELTSFGAQVRTMSGLDMWQFGAQATYLGVTVGANYQFGNYNFLYANPVRGDRNGESLNLGASYTAGPITVGANFVSNLWEGGSRNQFNYTGAAVDTLTRVANQQARERRWGLGIGANYRLAPGLDLIAEYVYHSRRESGRDYDSARAGIQDRVVANVFILGSRLAF